MDFGFIKALSMVNKLDLTNKVFGRLTALELSDKSDSSGHRYWKCKCSCGNPEFVYVRSSHLNTGRTKSCGCINRERITSHGASRQGDPRYKAYKMFHNAMRRAKENNQIFQITFEDVHIPERCPILNIELKAGEGHVQPNSPTLDKIIPEKGYVKGNVWVISHKANLLKSDATIEELESITKAVRKKIQEQQQQ